MRSVLAHRTAPVLEAQMRMNRVDNEQGIIKYGIAYMLGVPLSVLVIIFLLARAC